ncbi:MAG: hypothetical protein H8E98_02600 [Bacteroidetes bacterium]|nr:hypothetical protein [Bacteroidota bacterium]
MLKSELEKEIRKLKTIDELKEVYEFIKYQRSLLINLKLTGLKVNDRVSFEWNNMTLKGTITKINPKKVKVTSDHNGRFSIPALSLTKLENEKNENGK